jgi:hypothetical protein
MMVIAKDSKKNAGMIYGRISEATLSKTSRESSIKSRFFSYLKHTLQSKDEKQIGCVLRLLTLLVGSEILLIKQFLNQAQTEFDVVLKDVFSLYGLRNLSLVNQLTIFLCKIANDKALRLECRIFEQSPFLTTVIQCAFSHSASFTSENHDPDYEENRHSQRLLLVSNACLLLNLLIADNL